MFGEKRPVFQILLTGVSRVEFTELSEDHAPGFYLLGRVLNSRDGLTTAPAKTTGNKISGETEQKSKPEGVQRGTD